MMNQNIDLKKKYNCYYFYDLYFFTKFILNYSYIGNDLDYQTYYDINSIYFNLNEYIISTNKCSVIGKQTTFNDYYRQFIFHHKKILLPFISVIDKVIIDLYIKSCVIKYNFDSINKIFSQQNNNLLYKNYSNIYNLFYRYNCLAYIYKIFNSYFNLSYELNICCTSVYCVSLETNYLLDKSTLLDNFILDDVIMFFGFMSFYLNLFYRNFLAFINILKSDLIYLFMSNVQSNALVFYFNILDGIDNMVLDQCYLGYNSKLFTSVKTQDADKICITINK